MSIVTRDRTGWVTRWDSGTTRPEDPAAGLRAAQQAVRDEGGGPLVLWAENIDDRLDAIARAAGLEPWRDLLQMRCALPARSTDVVTRAFTNGDANAFVAVNNRAFAWHPEQGGMTRADLVASQREPWFDADGFRIHQIDGRLAGFCWTKVHPANDATGDPPLGEIYVIAVDPDFHGRKLGTALTLAGLDWLAGQGLETGMLYVEHDNEAAVRTYERIGFTVHHTDRAYRGTVA